MIPLAIQKGLGRGLGAIFDDTPDDRSSRGSQAYKLLAEEFLGKI